MVVWGSRDYGQRDVPSGLNGVVAIAGGGNISLALKATGVHFQNPTLLYNGSFGFNINEIYGRTVGLEASSNLKDWVPVTNFMGTNGVINFSEGTNGVGRFYRAVVP